MFLEVTVKILSKYLTKYIVVVEFDRTSNIFGYQYLKYRETVRTGKTTEDG